MVAVSDKPQALLHRAGHKALARRLSRETRGRNVIAHPDVTLPRDVAEALQAGMVFGTSEGESSTLDASMPQVVEVTEDEDEDYGVSVSERGVQTDVVKNDEPQGSMAEATRECREIVVDVYGKLSELSEAVRLVLQSLQQQTKGQADLADEAEVIAEGLATAGVLMSSGIKEMKMPVLPLFPFPTVVAPGALLGCDGCGGGGMVVAIDDDDLDVQHTPVVMMVDVVLEPGELGLVERAVDEPRETLSPADAVVERHPVVMSCYPDDLVLRRHDDAEISCRESERS